MTKRRKVASADEIQAVFVAALTRGNQPMSAVCERFGVSESCFYTWKKRYPDLYTVAQGLAADPDRADTEFRSVLATYKAEDESAAKPQQSRPAVAELSFMLGSDAYEDETRMQQLKAENAELARQVTIYREALALALASKHDASRR